MPENTKNLQMEDVINGYITKELVKMSELLPIGNDTKLISSRILNSLSLLKLVMFMEDNFGIIIDVEEVVPGNFETVGSICKYVKAKRGA